MNLTGLESLAQNTKPRPKRIFLRIPARKRIVHHIEYVKKSKNMTFKNQNTVPTHIKHTYSKHFSHNKQILFALTKMCLFGEEEDFEKINSPYFFQHWVNYANKNPLEILETFFNPENFFFESYKQKVQ